MRKSNILQYLFVMALIIGATVYACAPGVEEVEFTTYSNRFKNHLGITVNTKRGLLQGRESFLSFKRDYYSITMLVKGKAYAAHDMDITIHSKVEKTLTPRNGTVIIEEHGPNSLVVKITLKSDHTARHCAIRQRYGAAPQTIGAATDEHPFQRALVRESVVLSRPLCYRYVPSRDESYPLTWPT